MNAQTALQAQIDAQQLLDDVKYGLRSLKACGSQAGCVGVHAGQLNRAAAAAAFILDCEVNEVLYAQGGHGAQWRLQQAQKALREYLAEAKADVKAFGGKRQLRLALAADVHDGLLAA